jgi:hypothetical protein
MVDIALAAARTLAKEGIGAEVIDLRSLQPLDEETILASVKKTAHLVIVHEAPVRGGFGGEIVKGYAVPDDPQLILPVPVISALVFKWYVPGAVLPFIIPLHVKPATPVGQPDISTSKVTVSPAAMVTLSPSTGTAFPAHVAVSDHRPPPVPLDFTATA